MRPALRFLGCLFFSLAGFLFFTSAQPVIAQEAVTARTAAQPAAADDLISPQYGSDQCLTVAGADLSAAPAIVLSSCRGNANQYWGATTGASQWRTALDPTYCLATMNNTPGAGGRLTVRPCSDSRALTLLPNPTLTDSYQISGTTYVLDTGVYGHVAVAHQNGWSYQYWRWLQPDLAVVNQQGCAITYPFAAADTASYERELACDRVAKLQPPFTPPQPELAQRTLFPGAVPITATTVTRSYTFDLNFKSHGYLRQSTTPANWQSTGLYAPPGQILRVTVSNATADDLKHVYLRIGVHTDQLAPTSGNVKDDGFLRYPNVVVRVKLEPGENLVRSPYGGPIILDSGAALNKVITVEIANAVEAPYFKVGVTTETEWLQRRTAPVPYAELESDLAVIHVPSTEVRALSYADALATAHYYTQVGRLHNELSGLSANDSAIHQPPLGKYRHVADVQISAGWGHSGFPAMYFNAWQLGVPEKFIYRSAGWGVWHELGHNYQMGAWSGVYGGEVTVNLWSLYAQEKLYGNSRLVDGNVYATAIALLNDPNVTDKWGSADVFEQLVFLDQLRLGFPNRNWNLWTQLIRRYRSMEKAEYDAATASDQAKRDKFMTVLCEITQTNLTPHFDAWTIAVSQAAKDTCAAFAPLTQPIWLLDGAKPIARAGAGSGAFVREWWRDLSGATLTDLTNAPAYPATPSGSTILTGTLEGPRNWGNNYGERLRAYLHPPVTGPYEFWLAGDDSAQLRLSTDEDPLHATALLTLTTDSGYRDFDAFVNAVQRSQPITLEAGRAYYIETLHKEASGGDHLAVAWTIPAGDATPLEVRKVIDGRYLSPYAGDLVLQKRLATGQAGAIQAGADVTFTLTVINQGPVGAQQIELMDTLPISFSLSPLEQNPWQSGYRYVRFVAESEAGQRGEWASMAELGVLGADGQAIAPTNWRVMAVDSENGDAPAIHAIDGNPATLWHTQWWGSVDPYPHELQIDLGARYPLGGFTYLPRQSGYNGRVGNYRFLVSEDGNTWLEVAQGAFADNSSLKTVTFTPPPPRQLFYTLAGPLQPGAAASVNLILRAHAAITSNSYANQAMLINAKDRTNSPLYDRDLRSNQAAASVTVFDPTAVNNDLQLAAEPTSVYNQTPAALYPAQSSSGVFTVTAAFRNIGSALTDLAFQVTELRSRESGVAHYLLNAAGGPGQAGARYPIANAHLPDDSSPDADSWDNGEVLTVPFVLGLQERRPLVFLIDVYGKRSDATSDQATWLGHFAFALTPPPPTPTETAPNRLFLPLAQR